MPGVAVVPKQPGLFQLCFSIPTLIRSEHGVPAVLTFAALPTALGVPPDLAVPAVPAGLDAVAALTAPAARATAVGLPAVRGLLAAQ